MCTDPKHMDVPIRLSIRIKMHILTCKDRVTEITIMARVCSADRTIGTIDFLDKTERKTERMYADPKFRVNPDRGASSKKVIIQSPNSIPNFFMYRYRESRAIPRVSAAFFLFPSQILSASTRSDLVSSSLTSWRVPPNGNGVVNDH